MHGGGRTHSQGVSPKRGVLALYLGVFTLRKYPGGGRHVMWLHVVRFGKKHRGAFPLWEYDRDAGILRLVVPVESPESGKTHPSSPIIIPIPFARIYLRSLISERVEIYYPGVCSRTPREEGSPVLGVAEKLALKRQSTHGRGWAKERQRERSPGCLRRRNARTHARTRRSISRDSSKSFSFSARLPFLPSKAFQVR